MSALTIVDYYVIECLDAPDGEEVPAPRFALDFPSAERLYQKCAAGTPGPNTTWGCVVFRDVETCSELLLASAGGNLLSFLDAFYTRDTVVFSTHPNLKVPRASAIEVDKVREAIKADGTLLVKFTMVGHLSHAAQHAVTAKSLEALMGDQWDLDPNTCGLEIKNFTIIGACDD